MRVIAGVAKGHQLKAPKAGTTRPTSDLIKGAMFSIVEGISPAWSTVLDLYAGSGALGIEALSRWADRADFVESSPAACAVLRENLNHTKLTDKARIYCIPVEKAIASLRARYDIIIVDPPYNMANLSGLLESVAGSALVDGETTLVVEHSRRVALETGYGPLKLVKSRCHGDTVVSVFGQEA
ncbi:MAG: 16S rRNA (guanine(966)-N(2))-methyltransferase RsmD [Dehalococcoidia bacterium]|nr:16S rRNA (guanine(966)-N(2))-methyltransferase RsmD [Dehalococcoidia bacterium]